MSALFEKVENGEVLSQSNMLAVCMQGEGDNLSFFSRASFTVHGFA